MASLLSNVCSALGASCSETAIAAESNLAQQLLPVAVAILAILLGGSLLLWHLRLAVGSTPIPAGIALLPGALPLIGHAIPVLGNYNR